MINERKKKVLDKDGLTMENIIVKKLFNKNGVKYLTEKESDDFFFAQDESSANEYDWSFNWDNTITGLDTNTFIAPSNGWFSIDKISSSTLTITVNNKQNSSIKENGSFQALLKKDDTVTASTNFNYSFTPCNGAI